MAMSLLLASKVVISRSIASTTALALSVGTLMLTKASYNELIVVGSAGSGKTALTLETLSRRWFVASPF
jgi:Cdc6-like AAA superfamily ATPase